MSVSLDKPTPPLTCKVTDIFHDNVVVNWTPPSDDGGTEITRSFHLKFLKHIPNFNFSFPRYYIEALDRTLGGDWFQVGEAAPGDRKVTFCKMPNKFNQTSVVIKVLLFR